MAAVVDLVVELLVTAFVAASYMPQHVQCLKLRTAEGLSLWTVLISTISGVALALASVLGDWHNVETAAKPFFRSENVAIFPKILEITNVAMPMLQSLLMVFVGTPSYIVYFFRFGALPTGTVALDINAHNNDHSESTTRQEMALPPTHPHRRDEVILASITWTVIAASAAASLWTLASFGSRSPLVQVLVKFWGATAALTNLVQWIPQIDTTWNAKHEGVLSIFALIFSVLGDLLLALLWISSNGESIWVYMTLAADASMQIILIGIILCFRWQRRTTLASAALEERQESRPSTPLLSDSRKRIHLDIEQVEDDDDDNEAGSTLPVFGQTAPLNPTC